MNLFVVFLSFVPVFVCGIGLREEFTWNRLRYVAPANEYRIDVRKPGGRYRGNIRRGISPFNQQKVTREDNDDEYIFENNIPTGANRWKNKLFVTVPRRRNGIPSTLNYVWISTTARHNVPLIPYPNKEMNRLKKDGSFGIVSVYRTAVDACNRLWMVDTGKIETPGNVTQVQDSSILIFDLMTDTLIKRYILKHDDYTPLSTLGDITVDVTASNCDDAYAYIPDLGGYGLIIYSFRENDSWKVRHNYFYLEPLAGDLSVGGFNFQWRDGVFSVALSKIKDGYRTAYFHSVAGVNIYSVSTRILRDKKLATRSYHGNDFKVVGSRELSYQASPSALCERNGVLFLGLIIQNALGCLNTLSQNVSNPLQIGIVHKDDQKMIYPSSIKIYKDEVIVLTNKLPVFVYGQLDYSQINFRVWVENIDKAIEGTVCAT